MRWHYVIPRVTSGALGLLLLASCGAGSTSDLGSERSQAVARVALDSYVGLMRTAVERPLSSSDYERAKIDEDAPGVAVTLQEYNDERRSGRIVPGSLVIRHNLESARLDDDSSMEIRAYISMTARVQDPNPNAGPALGDPHVITLQRRADGGWFLVEDKVEYFSGPEG